MTNCEVINIRIIITSDGTIYWIREIKRSPDTMKAAAILVDIISDHASYLVFTGNVHHFFAAKLI